MLPCRAPACRRRSGMRLAVPSPVQVRGRNWAAPAPDKARYASVKVPGVPLLLVDLDNTLIDRAGAFARWAEEFSSARGSTVGDAQWLVAAGPQARNHSASRHHRPS